MRLYGNARIAVFLTFCVEPDGSGLRVTPGLKKFWRLAGLQRCLFVIYDITLCLTSRGVSAAIDMLSLEHSEDALFA